MDLRLLSLALLWSYELRIRSLTYALGIYDLRPWDSSGNFDFGFHLKTWLGYFGFIRNMDYSLLIWFP